MFHVKHLGQGLAELADRSRIHASAQSARATLNAAPSIQAMSVPAAPASQGAAATTEAVRRPGGTSRRMRRGSRRPRRGTRVASNRDQPTAGAWSRETAD